MSNLYELTSNYEAVMNMLYDDEIETEVVIDTLEAIEGELEDKAENIAKFIRNLDANAKVIKEEEERLNKRRKALENKVQSLKTMLENSMIVTGKKKFKTTLFSFNIQKNPPKLVIDKDVPEEFLVPQPPSVNNAAIKDLLKTQELDFAYLESTESLRIR